MNALIFAAGFGERMRPLTEHTPKPLLAVAGKPLIVWHIEKLAAIGVRQIVINTSWLAEQFPRVLGDGSHWGVHLHYSNEGPLPLETGGGMLNALPWLDGKTGSSEAFIAVNGDIWTDHDFARLPREPQGDAHLVLVANPAHHPAGDFALLGDGAVSTEGESRLTFSGVGVYRASLFDDWRRTIGNAPGSTETPARFKLAPLLRAAMLRKRVTGEHHTGAWTDVGTPERLHELDARLTPQ